MKKYLSMFICVLFLVSITFTNSVFAASVYESESNDDVSTANAIWSDCTINGGVSHDQDRDLFKVRLTSDSTLNIVLSSTTSIFNYGLYLLDSNGNSISSYDNYGTSKKISKALTANTYYVQLIYFGNFNTNLNYNLSIAGLPAENSYEHGGDMYEFNDSFSRATNIGQGSFVISQANLHPLGDTDYFKFSLKQNVNAVFTIAAPYEGLKYAFAIYDNNCKYITSGGGTSELRVNLASGSYYIKVYGIDSASVLNYRLQMNATATP